MMASEYLNWVDVVAEQEKEYKEKMKRIDQYAIECKSKEDKYAVITALDEQLVDDRAIIFCEAKEMAEGLAKNLMENGHSCRLLQQEKHDDSCDLTEDKEAKSLNKILITTDQLAKGVDADKVAVVVNYDLPVNKKNRADCETYLLRFQRLSQTEKGKVINLIHGFKSMTVRKMIEDTIEVTFSPLKLDDLSSIFKPENQHPAA